jgi:hypothetical protein
MRETGEDRLSDEEMDEILEKIKKVDQEGFREKAIRLY